jgi:hypothetical protein
VLLRYGEDCLDVGCSVSHKAAAARERSPSERLNDLVVARLAKRGHELLGPAHGAVFQYLDDIGTTLSVFVERAQIIKQAMAELVQYLETNSYVTRVPIRPSSKQK